MLRSITAVNFQHTEYYTMLLEAIDKGIDVTAYDSRELLDREALTNIATSMPEPIGAIRKELYHSLDGNYRQFCADVMGKNDKRKIYLQLLMMHELHTLLVENPVYQQKMAVIDTLMEQGHKKIAQGKLTSDALSATMFDALAAPTGNRIVIAGSAHINGMGNTDHLASLDPEQVHGTLPFHLCALGTQATDQQPPKVTQAVVATTAVQHDLNALQQKVFNPSSEFTAA